MQRDPFAGLILSLEVNPRFAIMRILILPAPMLVLLAQEQLHGRCKTRMAGIAEVTQDFEVLEQVCNVA